MSEKLKLVIVGGGTAGWMSAAALSALVTDKCCDLTLIESDQIATVGVGEATIPAIKEFNDRLGIIESDFMSKTSATFKLGIEFKHWGAINDSYIHPFGTFGRTLKGVDFHQIWRREYEKGQALELERYSFSITAARAEKFDFPATDAESLNSTYSYAYHFDAGLYADYLRGFAEKRGARRVEGKVVDVALDANSGRIQSVQLESGEKVEADYFIDCSGFQSLLLGKALGVKYESWKHWLPCDRAVAVQTTSGNTLTPYTQSIAHSAGWQWRIPLQHRTGNGLVYSSAHCDEAAALETLLSNVTGEAISEPKHIRFEAGRRQASWVKNCVGIGLSSGFLEPLESTSIYLIQVAIIQFIKLVQNTKDDSEVAKEFNRLVDVEYDRVRDFLILHYKLTQREDSEFWQYCRAMEVPESLQEKIKLYEKRGYIEQYQFGLFSPASWLAVLSGQGKLPRFSEPMTNLVSDTQAQSLLQELSEDIDQKVSLMQPHKAFIDSYCACVDKG